MEAAGRGPGRPNTEAACRRIEALARHAVAHPSGADRHHECACCPHPAFPRGGACGGAGGGALCARGGPMRKGTVGEAAHPATDRLRGRPSKLTKDVLRFRYTRRSIKKVRFEAGGGGTNDTYGGVSGVVVTEAELCVPASTAPAAPRTVLIFMHPTGVMHTLPMPIALARAGAHVLTAASRYPHNDTTLNFEAVARDLGAWVKHCREELGYDRVVLAGWSGGGSLSAYYQSLAEAGEDPENLPPADAVMIMAAHASRARVLTEWLDPSIYLLRRGDFPEEEAKLADLDMYGGPDPACRRAPYSAEWLSRFRAAQVARNRRITAWVHEQLKAREADPELAARASDGFIVEGTMAEPRWYDLSLDPNDRPTAGSCFLGDPRVANNAPTGVARFSTLRSWLSQWSIDESPADGVACLRRCTVPVLVLENSADDAVPTSHLTDMFEAAACRPEDKTYVRIEGANHYYDGMKNKIAEACVAVLGWLNSRGLTRIELPDIPGLPRAAPTAQTSEEAEHDAALPKIPDVAALRRAYDGSSPHAFKIRGINHLALTVADMERTCAFYGGVLGLRLTKTIALPFGGQHFFFDAGSPSGDQALAFFWFRDALPQAPGTAAPDPEAFQRGRLPTAAGAMNHVAFNVPREELDGYKERLEASPLTGWVSPFVYHADTPAGIAMEPDDPRVTWQSLYFFGPDGELLEVTAQTRPFREDDVEHMPQKALHRVKSRPS